MKTARDNPLYVRDCELCDCPLGFLQTAVGDWIPLDLRSPVYAPVTVAPNVERAVRTLLAYVSHYSTCPKASEFSKGRRP